MATSTEDDEAQLARLGYRQELKRTFSFFDNYSVSFLTMGFTSGVSALYGYAMYAGGPSVAFWNWLIVGCMASITSLVMAEICSSMPTAGGIYFWSAKLGGEKWGPGLAWLTAWWSWTGWLSSITSVAQGTTLFIVSFVQLNNPDYSNDTWKQFLITTALIVVSALINVSGERVIRLFLRASVFVFFIQYIITIIWLPVATPQLNTSAQVFQTELNYTGWTGSFGMVWLLGLLYPAYVFYGYDGSAHVAEETVAAGTRAAKGMYQSMISSLLFSIPLVLVYLYSTPSFVNVAESSFAQGVVTMWYEALGYQGCVVMLIFQIFTGSFTTTSNMLSAARITFAISRDHVIPFSSIWRKIYPSTHLPVMSIVLVAFLSIVLAVTIVGSVVAYNALASIGTIATTTSYIFPIIGRIIFRDKFERGPFHLGPFTEVLGTIAVLFIALEFAVLCMPGVYPVQVETFNYAPIMIAGITIISMCSWFFYARFWYHGPATEITEDERRVFKGVDLSSGNAARSQSTEGLIK